MNLVRSLTLGIATHQAGIDRHLQCPPANSRFSVLCHYQLGAMNQAMEGLEGLPDSQKQDLMQKIEEMQVRDR